MKKLSILIAAAVLAAVAAPAQDWAKARIEKSPRHGEWVEVKHGKREVKSFITYPEVKEKATAVVVVHEIFGLSDWARSVTDEFAEAGYIAIAPDLLSGKGTNGGGTAELDSGAIGRAIQSLPPDQDHHGGHWNAVVDYVSKLPSCNGKVVIIGFCWGGGQVFSFATKNKDLKAVFSCYGPMPTKADDLARINCPIYGFYGGNDARISAMVPAAIENMKKAGKIYDPVIYEGAGHGFMRGGEAPDAKEADKKAHDQAWQKIKDLLKKI